MTSAGSDVGAGMIAIPGGVFVMGSDNHYAEERPAHEVEVAPFKIDRFAVSNAQFASFVAATGYVTAAERDLDRDSIPNMPDEFYVAGSLVFTMTQTPVPLTDVRAWWRLVPGACWHHPEGPDSGVEAPPDHPVTHVSLVDVEAYAAWVGKSLPSEREWEYAARGGAATVYPWGDQLVFDGRFRANTWQGGFPWQNLASDGYAGSAPVDAYGPSGYGTYNMIGNVWEWTSDAFTAHHDPDKPCCTPRGAATPGATNVVKGGSYLCAASYCQRYRASARTSQDTISSTNHLGFRCVIR
jgi:sulfatase modifying factor 1